MTVVLRLTQIISNREIDLNVIISFNQNEVNQRRNLPWETDSPANRDQTNDRPEKGRHGTAHQDKASDQILYTGIQHSSPTEKYSPKSKYRQNVGTPKY